MAKHQRTLQWTAGTHEVIVLLPPELAKLFGLREGSHALVTAIEILTVASGVLIIVRDDRGEFRKFNESDSNSQVAQMVTCELDPATRDLFGKDAIFMQTTTGAVGFADTTVKFVEWDLWKALVFSRDDVGDLWAITFHYEIVPGEMAWDPLSETEKIRQLTEIQAAAGSIWAQPGTDPGEAYNKVDLGGNL